MSATYAGYSSAASKSEYIIQLQQKSVWVEVPHSDPILDEKTGALLLKYYRSWNPTLSYRLMRKTITEEIIG